MKKKCILCFGDSLVRGQIPGTDQERYPLEKRRTRILQKYLGSDQFEVIEEGLPGRTLMSDHRNPMKPGRNGYDYFLPCLDSHHPLDMVILMISTNSIKTRYEKTDSEIVKIVEERYIPSILQRGSPSGTLIKNLLIVCPPLINEDLLTNKEKFLLANDKLIGIGDKLEVICEKFGCGYMDTKGLLIRGSDGVHLDEQNNRLLAKKVYEYIQSVL